MSPAFANGRFPKAQMFVRGKTDNELALRTTFGLVRVEFAPRRLRWVCEEALGFSGTWDPPLARDSKGQLWIGLEHGVRIGPDGCKGPTVVRIEEETIGDLAETKNGVVGVTSTRGRAPRLFRGTGNEVQLLASGPEGMRFETVEAAPSRPDWIFVTGADYEKKPLAHLFRSRDGGKTLVEVTPKLAQDGPLFLSAIDPQNPERLYLRQITETGGTRILVSSDGGTTLKEVLSVPVPLLGLAQSLDGKVLLAAAADQETGMLRSLDRGEHWKTVSHVGAQCLFAHSRGFFACANPLTRGGDAILYSRDNGETFERFASFADVGSPDPCDAACMSAWPKMQQRLDPKASQDPQPDNGERADAATSNPTSNPTSTPSRAPDGGSAGGAESRRCGVPAGKNSVIGVLLLVLALRRQRGSSITQ
jgi:hypothetical protein